MKIKRIFATVLACGMLLSFPMSVSAADFTDVPEDHPYKAAINFCHDTGIVKGVSDTSFMPDSNLTRGEFTLMWCRALYLNEQNHSFSDLTSLKKYYDQAAITLYALGVLSGTSPTEFSPEDYVTREQLAVITMRTFMLGVDNEDAYQQYSDYASISDWARDGISSCINAEILEGLYDKENFEPSKPVTRAEACKLVYNLSKPAYTVTIDTLSGGTIPPAPWLRARVQPLP